jgi:hypothetical protein
MNNMNEREPVFEVGTSSEVDFGIKPPRSLEAIRLDRRRARRDWEYRRLLAENAQRRREAAERKKRLSREECPAKLPPGPSQRVYGGIPLQGEGKV